MDNNGEGMKAIINILPNRYVQECGWDKNYLVTLTKGYVSKGNSLHLCLDYIIDTRCNTDIPWETKPIGISIDNHFTIVMEKQ